MKNLKGAKYYEEKHEKGVSILYCSVDDSADDTVYTADVC